MHKKEIFKFRADLLNWYGVHHRKLPWRETDDPYRIWVSETMLQQTQVATVLPYYQKFCRQFPNVKILATAPQEKVLKSWEGLGYYARARNLHKSAKIICEKYNGKLPDNLEQIKQLPGVGDYIAAAVLSIAFHQVYPVVDGNVKRVLSRLFCIEFPVNISTSHARYLETAELLLDTRHPGNFNQAMMELGALICKPLKPQCTGCPVVCFCEAHERGKINGYPKRKKSRPIPEHHIAVGVVTRNQKVLITRRKNDGLLGGLWEFPGGKVKSGEKADNACIREIKEEVNLSIEVVAYLTCVKHAYTHFKITMDVFLCHYVKGRIKLNGPTDYRWIKLDEIDRYPFPKANHKFIPDLRRALQSFKKISDHRLN